MSMGLPLEPASMISTTWPPIALSTELTYNSHRHGVCRILAVQQLALLPRHTETGCDQIGEATRLVD